MKMSTFSNEQALIFNAIQQNNPLLSNYIMNNNMKMMKNKRYSMDFSSTNKNLFPFPVNQLQNKQMPNSEMKQKVQSGHNSGKNFSYTKVFQNNGNSLADDKSILDNIPAILRDQNGCRLVQKRLETRNQEFIDSFYEKIKYYSEDLINDQFGNYVMQKYIDVINKDRKAMTTFFESIQEKIYLISINQYGTRVLQKALDYMLQDHYSIANPTINRTLKGLILTNSYDLIQDTNGNHVFQKVLQIFPKQENQFFYDEIHSYYMDLAKSKKGGCIFQKAFDCSSKSQLVNNEI
jgi:hypothetical protein